MSSMENIENIQLSKETAIERNILPKLDFAGWLVVSSSLVFLAFITAQIFRLVENDDVTFIGNTLKTVIGIGGVLMSYSLTKKLKGNLKHTWKIITIAYFFNTFGDTIWFYYASILGEKPFPSLADIGFLLHYLVMFWALSSFPTTKKELQKKKIIVDVSIVMVSGATVVWYFIIHPILLGMTSEDNLSPVLNLAYTVGDMILLLGICVVYFRGVEENLKRTLQIIVAGIICMLIADLGFAYLTLQGTYFGGHWIENFFILNSVSHIFASYYQKGAILSEKSETSKEKVETPNDFFQFVPYFAIVIGYGVLVLETQPYWLQSSSLEISVFLAAGLTGLVVFRQYVSVRENEKLHAENAIFLSESRFRSLVQYATDVISIVNLDGTINYLSPSVKNVLGYEPEELIGRKTIEFYNPKEHKRLKEEHFHLIANPNETMRKEHTFLHRNGKWITFEGTARFFYDELTNQTGILLNLRDITERKENENKLRAFADKLQQSNRELQDFAFVASHDLQEPLRKVQAFGNRLATKYGNLIPEDGLDYLERMQSASNRMQTLINDLLTFSRVSTKAKPFEKTNLEKIVNEVLNDLEVKVEETNAKITIVGLPEICADQTQMRQLFQNLIGNALKFRKPDSVPEVKIYHEAQTFEEIENAEQLQIIVEDNGIGFDEKYADRIFTVFQRLHGRAEFEGSGVGLAVCRKIVERHGGQIIAQGSIGKGAKFIISLPQNIHDGGNENGTETRLVHDPIGG